MSRSNIDVVQQPSSPPSHQVSARAALLVWVAASAVLWTAIASAMGFF